MGPTVVVRSATSRALGAAMVVLAVLGLVSVLTAGPDALLRWGAAVALFGVAGWAAFWRPHVEVSDGGVRVVNTLRTVEVPWPVLLEVDGRYGLRLETAQGAVQAWGAAAPRRSRADRTPQSEAAQAVRGRWEALRAQGYLDQARPEQQSLPVLWHLDAVMALGALTFLAAVSLAL